MSRAPLLPAYSAGQPEAGGGPDREYGPPAGLRQRPLVFAHRGCSSLAPENTMAAYKKARDFGVPGIELDIHATLDGKLAVAHDDTFKRTAPPDNNGGGRLLEELSYDEIRRIDVGSFFGSPWSSERPPLLEDVLEEFCPAMYVDIELKSRKTKNDSLPGLLAEKLKALGGTISSAVTVSSFNPFALRTFKKAWYEIRNGQKRKAGAGRRALRETPDIPTAVIWSADREVPPVLRYGLGRIPAGCDYLKPVCKQVNAFSMFRFKLEGRPVVPWTVDDLPLAEKLINAGCAGIITNRPQDMTGLWAK